MTLIGVAAPLPIANIDTDQIIPGRFLKTIGRTGLGRSLFHARRYRPDGAENPDFVLNRPTFREAKILIAHENFGCGSSREHAAWALVDFGIRCVIAPSFGDIFQNNSLKNGLLPITLPRSRCDVLISLAELGANASTTVDLKRQEIVGPDGQTVSFTIEPFRKDLLLKGLDEIGETLQHLPAIATFEASRTLDAPWLPR